MWRVLLILVMGCGISEMHTKQVVNQYGRQFGQHSEFMLPKSYENWHGQLWIAKRDIGHYVDQLDDSGDKSAAAEAARTLQEVLNFAPATMRQTSQPNLHVVSLYEGSKHDDFAEVLVEDTSGPVVLCVCAYRKIRWKIRAKNGVDLRRVIVGGSEEQEIDSSPEGVQVAGRSHSDDRKYRFYGYSGSSSWANVDSALRKIIQLPVATRLGQYRYEGRPLIVGPKNDDWLTQLKVRALRDLQLQAMVYRASNEEQDVLCEKRPLLFRNGSCSIGEGTILGPAENSLQTVNGDIHRLTSVPQFGWYTLHDYLIKKVDRETGELSVTDLPRLEKYHGDWPITADTDRNRLYVWGYQLRSIDLQTGEAVVHRQGNSGSIASIAYCSQRKCLFGISASHHSEGHSASRITRMNLRGADIAHVNLELPLSFRGRPRMWMANGRLVICGQTQSYPRTHSYVFNVDTGQLLFACRFQPRVTNGKRGRLADQPPGC